MPTFADLSPLRLALEAFLTAKQAARCTERTIAHYRWTLDRFLTWLAGCGVEDLTGITPHVFRLYLVHLQNTGLGAGSVRDAARIVKTWLRFLYRDGLMLVDVAARLTLPRADQVLLPAFTAAEVKTLLAASTGRNHALLLLLLDTGCRVSECCGLDVNDFDAQSGALVIRQGKGRKDRMVYLGAKAKRALLKYLVARQAQAGEPLFCAAQGTRLTVDGIQSLLLRLGQRTGVAHCHPHTFRRTFALWSLRAGMNVYALQRLMGHTDLTMLKRYLALAETDLQAAHAAHSAVDQQL